MAHLNEYPFRDTQPGRCFLWHHHKAVVQWLGPERRERYDCACGKFYWLSGIDGRKPLIRFAK